MQPELGLLMLGPQSFSFTFNGNSQHPIIGVFILSSYFFTLGKASHGIDLSKPKKLKRRKAFHIHIVKVMA